MSLVDGLSLAVRLASCVWIRGIQAPEGPASRGIDLVEKPVGERRHVAIIKDYPEALRTALQSHLATREIEVLLGVGHDFDHGTFRFLNQPMISRDVSVRRTR